VRFLPFQKNPILLVEIRGIRQRVRKKQVLTPEQFQTLVANADLRLQVMMTLACCLGLRPSEFLGLQWPDLNVDRGILMVCRSITGLHVEATKTPDSEDEITIDPDIVALLLRWREQCPDPADQQHQEQRFINQNERNRTGERNPFSRDFGRMM